MIVQIVRIVRRPQPPQNCGALRFLTNCGVEFGTGIACAVPIPAPGKIPRNSRHRKPGIAHNTPINRVIDPAATDSRSWPRKGRGESEMEPKKYEDIKITGNDRDGYTVTYYEWVQGQGRDCGLNRTGPKFQTRREAREYADALRAESRKGD